MRYIPDIFHSWNSTAIFKPVKSRPKSAEIRDNIAKMGLNMAKFRVLCAKSLPA